MKVCPTYKLWVSQSVSNSIKIKYNKVGIPIDRDFRLSIIWLIIDKVFIDTKLIFYFDKKQNKINC